MSLTVLRRRSLIQLTDPIQAAKRTIALTEIRDKRSAELTAAQSTLTTVGGALSARLAAWQAMQAARIAQPFVKATLDTATDAYCALGDIDAVELSKGEPNEYTFAAAVAARLAGMTAEVTRAQHAYDQAVAALAAETAAQTANAAELLAG